VALQYVFRGLDSKGFVGQKSLELGVTTLDTAPVYGFGRSEEAIGRVIKGKREKVQILTKFGLDWESEDGSLLFEAKDLHGKPVKICRNGRKNRVIEECERSLKRLETD